MNEVAFSHFSSDINFDLHTKGDIFYDNVPWDEWLTLFSNSESWGGCTLSNIPLSELKFSSADTREGQILVIFALKP